MLPTRASMHGARKPILGEAGQYVTHCNVQLSRAEKVTDTNGQKGRQIHTRQIEHKCGETLEPGGQNTTFDGKKPPPRPRPSPPALARWANGQACQA
jgi:hypothetical protein